MGSINYFNIGILGSAPSVSPLREGIALAVVGLLVVFFALSVTAIMIAVLNRFVGTTRVESSPAAAGGHTRHGSVDERRLKVVLAAAATVALGGCRVKINQVTPRNT